MWGATLFRWKRLCHQHHCRHSATTIATAAKRVHHQQFCHFQQHHLHDGCGTVGTGSRAMSTMVRVDPSFYFANEKNGHYDNPLNQTAMMAKLTGNNMIQAMAAATASWSLFLTPRHYCSSSPATTLGMPSNLSSWLWLWFPPTVKPQLQAEAEEEEAGPCATDDHDISSSHNHDSNNIWRISTLKRRRKKMNKHKYKKRRKIIKRRTKLNKKLS